jgi:hypothetical protein
MQEEEDMVVEKDEGSSRDGWGRGSSGIEVVGREDGSGQ